VPLIGLGKHARELRVAVDRAKRPATTLGDGMDALVTTLPAETHTTEQVFPLFTARHDVERSNHLLKGHLRVSPVYLKKPMRIEGLLCMLWMALVACLLIEREYRHHTRIPPQKRRTTRNIFEVCEGSAWVLIKVSEGYYRRPSVLTVDQQEIYTVWKLNPPEKNPDRTRICTRLSE
jgi:transposase